MRSLLYGTLTFISLTGAALAQPAPPAQPQPPATKAQQDYQKATAALQQGFVAMYQAAKTEAEQGPTALTDADGIISKLFPDFAQASQAVMADDQREIASLHTQLAGKDKDLAAKDKLAQSRADDLVKARDQFTQLKQIVGQKGMDVQVVNGKVEVIGGHTDGGSSPYLPQSLPRPHGPQSRPAH